MLSHTTISARKHIALAIFAFTFFHLPVEAKTKASLHHLTFAADTERIYSVVEHAPQPGGGIDGFTKFFLNNIRYAFHDNESALQGRIFLKFIVEKDGSLSPIAILESPSPGVTNAAIRILKMCPNWVPGTQNEKAVRVQYIVPINFNTAVEYQEQPVLTKIAPINYSPDANGIYTSPETLPVAPGGEEGLGNFLRTHIHYPILDKESRTQGRVYIQFVVEKDGSLSSFKVLRAPSASLGEEAVRVLKLMPNWEPGKMHGEPVRVSYTIPVNFTLGDVRPNFGAFYQTTLTKFIFDNVKYPKELQDQGISGNVIVAFTISNHMPTGAKVIKSAGALLDNEAMTLIQNYHPPETGPAGTFLVSFRFYVNEKPPYENIPADIMKMGYFVVDAVIKGSRFY